MLTLDPARTALLVVDVLPFAIRLDTAPRPGRAVFDAVVSLVNACRDASAHVVLVEPGGSPHAVQPTDAPLPPIVVGPQDRTWPAEIGPRPGDIVVGKPRWGAFHGTDLDASLRSRGVETVLVAGIATDIGVEATARQAYDAGYHVVVVEDATAAFTADAHEAALRHTFPVIGRVRSTGEVLAALHGDRAAR
jgi:nicotinamidase-related amidase